MSTIEIIWESKIAIAVNKPAGLSTQNPQGHESLETALIEQLGRQNEYLTFPHRLDRVVSGVTLVALTKKAARLLSDQFSSRKTQKQYLALVEGRFNELGESEMSGSEIRWDDCIRKIDGQAKAEACDDHAPGAKQAGTIVRHLGFDPETQFSRLELNPITGRMHQLRLQCALRGHPIVGDELYGAANRHSLPSPSTQYSQEVTPIMLHAHRLGFHDPTGGRWTEVVAPCPF